MHHEYIPFILTNNQQGMFFTDFVSFGFFREKESAKGYKIRNLAMTIDEK